MPVWYNADGLLIKTGRDEAVTGTVGEYGTVQHGNHIVEAKIALATLTSTPAILDDYVRFPKGQRIERVEIYVEGAATSGGAATFNLGFVGPDRSTGGASTALASAIALTAIDTAGKKVVLEVGSTGAGTYIGSTNPSFAGAYLTAFANVAAFTAGQLTVRIFYHKP